jgi:hypothetical protein
MTAPVAGAQGLGRLARQSRTAWARSQYVIAETRMLAKVVAATEDQVAVTFARLAERRPDSAERLRRLSEDARREAMHLRDRAQAGGTALSTVGRDMISVRETRICEQCGAAFAPRREHARFCSSLCRDSWNRERGGDLRSGASTLDWTAIIPRPAKA